MRADRDSVAPYTLADLRYSFDDAGNITKTADVAADPVDDTQCFGHDHLRRLTQAWTPASGDCAAAPSALGLGGPAPYWHSWDFDTVGNRLSQTIYTTTGDSTTTYAYPTAGGTQPHTLSATSGAQTGEYTYDDAGNTICRPAGVAANDCGTGTGTASQTLTWDPEGHLATSTDASGTTTYIYDADGNRLIRRDPTGKTLYLPGEEIRYTTATGATACTRYYTHAGQTIASRTAAGLIWLTGDHQGTAQVAIDQTTQAADIRRQVPFGNPRGTTPAWPNDKGFVGGTIDNTGLTHLGARQYDAELGRFISVDPVMDLTDTQQLHGYSYANNSPINMSDPDGLRPVCDEAGNVTCGNSKAGGSQQNECNYENARANYYCQQGDSRGPSVQEAIEQEWRTEYEKIVKEVEEKFHNAPVLTDPNFPEVHYIAAQGAADQMLCERVGPENCLQALMYIASAGTLIGIGTVGRGSVNYAARTESRNLVVDSVNRQLARGWPALFNELSPQQKQAYTKAFEAKKFYKVRMFLGSALHNATFADLEKKHPGRFQYNASRGPDLYDSKTKVRVEITTRLGFMRHWTRTNALYRAAVYVLYRGPGRVPSGGRMR